MTTATEIPLSPGGFPQPWKIAPHHVYEMYAADGRCLYVGCTMRLAARLSTHEKHSEWWSDTVRFLVTTYPDEATGFAAERAAIKLHQPKYNVVHTDEHKDRVRRGWETRRRNHAAKVAQFAAERAKATAEVAS